jgi:hypothetical protein
MRIGLARTMQSAMVLSFIIAAAPAIAQSSKRDAAAQAIVLGPATREPGAADLPCGTGPAGLGSWDAGRIEKTLSIDGAQHRKFDDLKTASQRAIQYLSESCPKGDPVTPIGRLEASERRLSAMLEAVRTVQPALDDFYAALTDEQKARLASLETGNDGGAADHDRQGHARQRRGGSRIRLPLPRLF